MSLVLADRVRETTQTTGTGTITLDGAVQGFQSFSVIGNNNTTYYTINRGSEWEVGLGTYYGGTLSRDTVYASSNGGAKVNFSTGSKDVFVTYPASKSVNEDANNRVLIPYTSGTTNVGSLNVGNATAHTDSGVIAGFTASEPLYLYTSLQNTSSANTSYASYAVNDGGHTAYGELGINNSNYSYSAAGFPNNGFSIPLATFVESYGGPLVLGSWDSQKISFIVNGASNTSDAMTVETSGAVTIPSIAATGGTINGTPIGGTTPSTGTFITLSLTGTSNQVSSVAVSSDPAAPSAGNLETFARTQSGFTTLAFENNTNAVAPFQTMMPFRKISMWNAGGSQSATAPAIFGFGALTILGTNTATAPASTNMITRTRRLNYISSAVAGNFAGHYEAASNIYLGSATTPAYSGFYFSVRFFIADTVASPRTFVGLTSSVAAPTNVEPSTLTNCIGVGQGAADTNLKIYYGGSAAQTPIDLGVNFPTGTSNTDLYELNLFSPPTSNNTVYYAVKRLNTAHIATGTLTGTTGTVLPLNTQVISYRAWRTNNATATAVNVAIVGVYCETDF